jgi:sugar diacid utilization regulator
MTGSSADDRSRQEVAVLREMVEVYSKLSGLASQGSDLASVVELVVARIGVSAAVVDTDLQVVAAAAPEGQDGVFEGVEADGSRKALDRLFDAAARTRRSLTLPGTSRAASSVVVAPIVLGDELVAYLLTAARDFDDRTEDIRLMVTEHAAMVCAILLGRVRVVAAAAGQARRDLFEGLLLQDRNEAEVENWARHLGIKPDQPHRVVTLAFGDGKPSGSGYGANPTKVTTFAERYLHNRAPEATVMTRGEEIVAVFPISAPDPGGVDAVTTLVRRCKESVESQFAGVTLAVGIGNCYEGAGLIARSYAEARHAVDTGRMLSGLGGVVVFSDLGIHRLLVRVRDVDDLRTFAHDVLGTLIEHDQNNRGDYLTTLTMYFNENNSPQRTARRLHMHPNTVTYRIRRIEEIIGLSLSSYSDRLIIQVALEIANGLGDRP